MAYKTSPITAPPTLQLFIPDTAESQFSKLDNTLAKSKDMAGKIESPKLHQNTRLQIVFEVNFFIDILNTICRSSARIAHLSRVGPFRPLDQFS